MRTGRNDQEVSEEKYNQTLTCFGIDREISRIGVKYR